jgi:hypothetical protein
MKRKMSCLYLFFSCGRGANENHSCRSAGRDGVFFLQESITQSVVKLVSPVSKVRQVQYFFFQRECGRKSKSWNACQSVSYKQSVQSQVDGNSINELRFMICKTLYPALACSEERTTLFKVVIVDVACRVSEFEYFCLSMCQ